MSNFERRSSVALAILFFCAGCGSVSRDSAASDGGAVPDGSSSGAPSDAGMAVDSAPPDGASLADAGGAGGSASVSSEAGAAGETAPDADAGMCASRFATSVVSFTPGTGPNTGQDKLPGIVLGPPQGGGADSGSLDVATLGNGGSIILGFAPSVIVDRPGPDFIVFENPFDIGGDPTKPFAEVATVGVSDDGITFKDFPCTATIYPYGMCAGWHPVFANPGTNDIDPTDPAVAGGDDFDLADLGVTEARFVRITDRVDLPSTFDLDAVSIVHAECP